MARPLARRTGGFPGVTLSGRPGRHLGRGGGILRKCEAHWWGPRTSNPVYLLNKGVGGFDSHALPPTICGAGGQHCWPPFSLVSRFEQGTLQELDVYFTFVV